MESNFATHADQMSGQPILGAPDVPYHPTISSTDSKTSHRGTKVKLTRSVKVTMQ